MQTSRDFYTKEERGHIIGNQSADGYLKAKYKNVPMVDLTHVMGLIDPSHANTWA